MHKSICLAKYNTIEFRFLTCYLNNSEPETETYHIWSSFSIKKICCIYTKFTKQTNTSQEISFLVLALIAPKGAAKLIKDCEH